MTFAFSCKETSLASQSLEELPIDHKIKSLGALLGFLFCFFFFFVIRKVSHYWLVRHTFKHKF